MIRRSQSLFLLSVSAFATLAAGHVGCASATPQDDSSTGELGLAQPASARLQNDMRDVAGRGDVKNLPRDLKKRLVELAGRPHSHVPTQAFAEANKPSQLFQYYLLEAKDLNDAIRLATKIPPVQHGSVEVRPVRELDVSGFQSFTDAAQMNPIGEQA